MFAHFWKMFCDFRKCFPILTILFLFSGCQTIPVSITVKVPIKVESVEIPMEVVISQPTSHSKMVKNTEK